MIINTNTNINKNININENDPERGARGCPARVPIPIPILTLVLPCSFGASASIGEVIDEWPEWAGISCIGPSGECALMRARSVLDLEMN